MTNAIWLDGFPAAKCKKEIWDQSLKFLGEFPKIVQGKKEGNKREQGALWETKDIRNTTTEKIILPEKYVPNGGNIKTMVWKRMI